MAGLDVSDVINDPDFQSSFTVTSTTRVVGLNGRPILPYTVTGPTAALGVVIPGKSSLRRLDDGSRIEAFIDIWTQYPLTGGTKASDTTSRAADIITWRGRSYTVAMVEDYSDFGAGFLHVSADLLPLNPPT